MFGRCAPMSPTFRLSARAGLPITRPPTGLFLLVSAVHLIDTRPVSLAAKSNRALACILFWLVLFGTSCSNNKYAAGGKICKAGSCLTIDFLADNLESQLQGKVTKFGFIIRHGLA